LAEAAKAVADGKWSDAAAAYQACLELKPLDEYRAKMNSAKAEEFAAKGKMLEDSGLLKEALEQYLEALKYNPQHPRALEFVKRQGQAEQLAGFLKAGDEAMVRNDFRGAASSYTSALGVAGDQQKPDIQKKLNEAKNKETMVEAHDALAQNNFAKAREKANEAKTYVDSADIPPFLEEVDKREQFKQKMDVALELMKQGKFLPAIAEFRAAYKIFADPKIPALISECEYRRHFLEAKLLLDAKKYTEARAMFILAQRYKDTAEVQAYIKICEDLLKAPKKGEGGP
jgi:tetratricopeptide (TPR) repeat protein